MTDATKPRGEGGTLIIAMKRKNVPKNTTLYLRLYFNQSFFRDVHISTRRVSLTVQSGPYVITAYYFTCAPDCKVMGNATKVVTIADGEQATVTFTLKKCKGCTGGAALKAPRKTTMTCTEAQRRLNAALKMATRWCGKSSSVAKSKCRQASAGVRQAKKWVAKCAGGSVVVGAGHLGRHRVIRGSSRREFTESNRLAPTNPFTIAEVTVVLTPDSTPSHAAAIATMAARYDLLCMQREPEPHMIRLAGPIVDLQRAFQVELFEHSHDDGTCRCRTGPISVPESFGSNVVAVLGLDTRPQSRAHFHSRTTAPRVDETTLNALTVASAYGFPESSGEGHSVGIIELGGIYQPNAMDKYFDAIGLQVDPNVVARGPQRRQTSATTEVMLDAEIIAAVVPAARTVIYFAPNTTVGFYNAIARAMQNGHDAISISWGAPEAYWTPSAMTAFNNLARRAGDAGVTITAASGDAGSSDGLSGVEVDFPASAPYILGCGGTNLVVEDGAYVRETVWNGNGGSTGGGLSEYFSLPEYQAGVGSGVSGNTARMVPDVAANADPGSGYFVRVGGRSIEVGGTSAASPLWAALVCRLNAILGRRLGFINPALYALPSGSLRQVTSGSNGAYSARQDGGFSLCCGLGTPPSNLVELLTP